MERRKFGKNVLSGLGLGATGYGLRELSEASIESGDKVYSVSDPRPYRGIDFEKYESVEGSCSQSYEILLRSEFDL